MENSKVFDFAILGSGLSGSIWAHYCITQGHEVCVLEAGQYFRNPSDYPQGEVNANNQLYWNGGAELNTQSTLGFLRPKVVGGGSVVNQALLDRFDDEVWSDWKTLSQIDFEKQFETNRNYDIAKSKIKTKTFTNIDTNKNAQKFIKGCDNNGYQWSYLTRAESHCVGHDCIECLAGCKWGSKQSADRVYFDNISQATNLDLKTRCQALAFEKTTLGYKVFYLNSAGVQNTLLAKKIVLAMGSVGNTLFLLNSGLKKTHSTVGENFFTHPQFMTLGVYPDPIHAENGSFQTVKSQDPSFKKKGFKLENVFAQPVGLAMLIPEIREKHGSLMNKITHMSCIEVAIKDTCPGQIKTQSPTRARIIKNLDAKDLNKKKQGILAIHNIFKQSGATQIIDGKFGIGLHLMGACAIGSNMFSSVFNPEFELWNNKGVYCSDSSIFPAASGINPSLTIMALTHHAAQRTLGI